MTGYSTALVIKESHITTVNTLLCAQTAPSVPSDWKKIKRSENIKCHQECGEQLEKSVNYNSLSR